MYISWSIIYGQQVSARNEHHQSNKHRNKDYSRNKSYLPVTNQSILHAQPIPTHTNPATKCASSAIICNCNQINHTSRPTRIVIDCYQSSKQPPWMPSACPFRWDLFAARLLCAWLLMGTLTRLSRPSYACLCGGVCAPPAARLCRASAGPRKHPRRAQLRRHSASPLLRRPWRPRSLKSWFGPAYPYYSIATRLQ